MVPDLTWLGIYWYCSKYQIIKKINVGNKIAAIFKTGGLDFEYIVHCGSAVHTYPTMYKVCNTIIKVS